MCHRRLRSTNERSPMVSPPCVTGTTSISRAPCSCQLVHALGSRTWGMPAAHDAPVMEGKRTGTWTHDPRARVWKQGLWGRQRQAPPLKRGRSEGRFVQTHAHLVHPQSQEKVFAVAVSGPL